MSVIKSGLNTFWPVSFCKVPGGEIYVANGLDRPMRWDGRTSQVENAGIDAPGSTCIPVAGGSGLLYGDYKVYVRFIDDQHIPSCLSPVASLSIPSTSKAARISYYSIPVSSDSRVVGRQIWRNTYGQEQTWYLDLEIYDNATTIASSTRTDEQLMQRQAMPMYTKDGYPNANRFVPPPDFMSAVVSYRDRTWWSVPVEYNQGSISVSGTTVTGANVSWDFPDRDYSEEEYWSIRLEDIRKGTLEYPRRRLFVAGKEVGELSTKTSSTQWSLREDPGSGINTDNDYYAIAPPTGFRNAVVFSELGEPESCPPCNMLVLDENDDSLTAMMPLGSYLYLMQHEHIYRLSTSGDPRRDAAVVLAAERGCLNQRCWVRVEGQAIILDRNGVYAWGGGEPQPISTPYQDYFRGRITWEHAKWFHAVHDPTNEVVKFFVCLDGATYPKHALCYNYRNPDWWVEKYAYTLGCSCRTLIQKERRVVAGAEDRVMLMDEGVLDGVAARPTFRSDRLTDWPDDTIRGTVTAATAMSITDSNASYDFDSWFADPGIEGAPLTVIDSNGNWQTKRIASIDATNKKITVMFPFTVAPSAGDVYIIGGIPWWIKLGTWKFFQEGTNYEQEALRRYQLQYKALNEPTTLNLRTYLNMAETPLNIEIDHDTEDGVTTISGSPNVQVDLTRATGSVQYGLPGGAYENRGPAERFLDVKLEGVSGRQKVKLYSLAIDGVHKRG